MFTNVYKCIVRGSLRFEIYFTLKNNLSATLNNSEEVKTLILFVSINFKCHKPSDSSQKAVLSLPKSDKFSHREVLWSAY